MNIDENGAKLAFRNAYRALRLGDRAAARRWAFQAVALWHDYEEPWLILAAIASSHGSVAYLERARLIHPDSPRANAGLRWAQARLQSAQTEPGAQPGAESISPIITWSSDVQGRPGRGRSKIILARLVGWFALVLVIAIVLLAGALLKGGIPAGQAARVALATATAIRRTVHPETPAPATDIALPSPTATVKNSSPTPSSTPQPTSTPTFTFTPEATQTATVTATAVPTATHPPTAIPKTATSPATIYTVRRGDTLSRIAASFGVSVQSLAKVNNIFNPSVIQAGQRLTIPVGGSAAPVKAVTGQKRVVVDLSEQRLYAYLDNQPVFSFVISTGRGGGTATGNFSILDKDPNAWSAPWGFWMPYWMGIYFVGSNLENGIHSLPVLTSGVQIWGDAIGTPVSYGCVVLRPDDARQLFNWVNIGTPVQIKN